MAIFTKNFLFFFGLMKIHRITVVRILSHVRLKSTRSVPVPRLIITSFYRAIVKFFFIQIHSGTQKKKTPQKNVRLPPRRVFDEFLTVLLFSCKIVYFYYKKKKKRNRYYFNLYEKLIFENIFRTKMIFHYTTVTTLLPVINAIIT